MRNTLVILVVVLIGLNFVGCHKDICDGQVTRMFRTDKVRMNYNTGNITSGVYTGVVITCDKECPILCQIEQNKYDMYLLTIDTSTQKGKDYLKFETKFRPVCQCFN